MSTKRKSDIGSLHPVFRSGILWLEHTLEVEQIHMVRWETLRTNERQGILFERGNSKARPGKSAHNWGLAADYVLDTSKVEVAKKIWKNRWVSFAWDIESPKAKETWIRFGEVVRGLGFSWGGDFGSTPISKGIGWDYPHVELKNYKKYMGR